MVEIKLINNFYLLNLKKKIVDKLYISIFGKIIIYFNLFILIIPSMDQL